MTIDEARPIYRKLLQTWIPHWTRREAAAHAGIDQEQAENACTVVFNERCERMRIRPMTMETAIAIVDEIQAYADDDTSMQSACLHAGYDLNTAKEAYTKLLNALEQLT